MNTGEYCEFILKKTVDVIYNNKQYFIIVEYIENGIKNKNNTLNEQEYIDYIKYFLKERIGLRTIVSKYVNHLEPFRFTCKDSKFSFEERERQIIINTIYDYIDYKQYLKDII
jgi:hypothetical protein